MTGRAMALWRRETPAPEGVASPQIDARATHVVLVRGTARHLTDSEAEAVRIAQQAAQGSADVVTAKRLADGGIVWTSEGKP